MAHLVQIEDDRGDLVDLNYYCSDWCAKQDPLYAGWFGCQEISCTTACNYCEDEVKGLDECG